MTNSDDRIGTNLFRDLSGRERQILALTASGLLDKQVAAELQIAGNTLSTYWSRIRKKGGNLSRGALVAMFVKTEKAENELIEESPQAPPVLLHSTDTLRRAAFHYLSALQEIRAALERADRVERILESYSQLCSLAITSTHLAHILCQVLVEEANYEMAWVGLGLRDEAKSIHIVESFGDSNGYLETTDFSWGDGPTWSSPTSMAIRTGKVQIYPFSASNSQTASWTQHALFQGFRSGAAFPLRGTQEGPRVLTVYSQEYDAFDARERGLLEAIAEDFSDRLGEFSSP